LRIESSHNRKRDKKGKAAEKNSAQAHKTSPVLKKKRPWPGELAFRYREINKKRNTAEISTKVVDLRN
jgi:hypothetical protein